MKPVRIVSIVTAVFGLCIARPALAMEDGACRDDVKKFCGDVKPGGGAIKDCIKAHEAELSAGCKEKIAMRKEKHEEKMKAVKEACAADIKQFCANVTPGEGREFACLHAYSDKLSAGCKEKLPMHHHPGMHKDMGGEEKGPAEGK